MSIAQISTRSRVFVSRFVEELEFLALQGKDQATGDQIIEAAFDIMRIDLRVTDDLQAAFKELPFELYSFLKHAYENRSFVFQPLSRHINTAKELAGAA